MEEYSLKNIMIDHKVRLSKIAPEQKGLDRSAERCPECVDESVPHARSDEFQGSLKGDSRDVR
jgi:hypothetical protein